MTPQKKRQNLTAECDALFGKIIRSRGACLNCGSGEVIQCAHGFSRRYRSVRWDERNAFPLCRRCHVLYTHRPLEWDEWLVEMWGYELYEELRRLALRGPVPDLKDMRARLRERWEALEAAA